MLKLVFKKKGKYIVIKYSLVIIMYKLRFKICNSKKINGFYDLTKTFIPNVFIST